MSAQPRSHLDVCHACGKLFARTNVKLCQTCATNEDFRFSLVKAYLGDSPRKSFPEIIEATGITMAEINRFYSQGRLVESRPESAGLACTCRGRGSCGFCRYQTAEQFGALRDQMQSELPLGDPSRVRYVRRRHRDAG